MTLADHQPQTENSCHRHLARLIKNLPAWLTSPPPLRKKKLAPRRFCLFSAELYLAGPALTLLVPTVRSLKVTSYGPHLCESIAYSGVSSSKNSVRLRSPSSSDCNRRIFESFGVRSRVVLRVVFRPSNQYRCGVKLEKMSRWGWRTQPSRQ